MKAVIFDMDGVIIDSEPIHNREMAKTFRHFGADLNVADLEKYVGTTNAFVFQNIKDTYGLSVSVEEMDRWHYQNILRTFRDEPIGPIPGIRPLLQKIKRRGVPAAIASSSPMELIKTVMDKFAIGEYFIHLTSGEDLPKSKPDPAIYLLSAEKLGVCPADCLVIEDARLGVQAAKAAGMSCVGFQNPNSGNQDLSQADQVVEQIADIRLEDF